MASKAAEIDAAVVAGLFPEWQVPLASMFVCVDILGSRIMVMMVMICFKLLTSMLFPLRRQIPVSFGGLFAHRAFFNESKEYRGIRHRRRHKDS